MVRKQTQGVSQQYKYQEIYTINEDIQNKELFFQVSNGVYIYIYIYTYLFKIEKIVEIINKHICDDDQYKEVNVKEFSQKI